MAASELAFNTSSSSNLLASTTLLRTLHQYKEKATDHLLLRDFKECKKTCDSGIAFAKLHIEEESAQETIESLCLLCIQAFAELNSWQDVLPYVQNVYSGIEACPSAVIQLCILLHAKVKEYQKCHAIASIWLKCLDNVVKCGYTDVAALYVSHVLVPQGQTHLASQFLNSCTHLDTERKEKILKEIVSVTSRMKVHELSKETSQISADRVHDPGEEDKKEVRSSLEMIKKTVKEFGVMVVRKLSFISLKTVVKIAALTACLYLVAIQANKGDLMSNFGRASVVWQGAMKILKSMFGPYRPGS